MLRGRCDPRSLEFKGEELENQVARHMKSEAARQEFDLMKCSVQAAEQAKMEIEKIGIRNRGHRSINTSTVNSSNSIESCAASLGILNPSESASDNQDTQRPQSKKDAKEFEIDKARLVLNYVNSLDYRRKPRDNSVVSLGVFNASDCSSDIDNEKAQTTILESKLFETEKISIELNEELIQLRQKVQSLEEELRSESDKSKNLELQVEQLQRRNLMLSRSDSKKKSLRLQRATTIEKQLTKEIQDLKDVKKNLDDEIKKLKQDVQVNELQITELKEQLEAETYFSSLYNTQVEDLKVEVGEKNKQIQNLTSDGQRVLQEKCLRDRSVGHCRVSINAQLQLALAKADSETLARQIAEEQLSDFEKERTMFEIEIKELMSRFKVEVENSEILKHNFSTDIEKLQQENDSLKNKIATLYKEVNNSKKNAVGKLKKKLEEEKLKKIQEREKCNKMVEKMQRDAIEALQSVYQENQARQRLQIEIDAKDSELEQLRQKLAFFYSDTASFYSCDTDDSKTVSEDLGVSSDSHMEGWLAVPNRNNIKKYGWKKQYVVVSSRKVLFFNTENDKQNTDPIMVLDIDKLFHVRPVTQGDVYRADAKDIPRIFQILYASEGENRKPDEVNQESAIAPLDRSGVIIYKGHDLVPISFRTPTSCGSCHKIVWHMIHPPPALECKRCHVKVHRDHYDKNEEFLPYCKVNYDSNILAKEMLLLAESTEKQKNWVQHLSKKVSKNDIVSSGNLSTGTVRGTKQYSSYGPQQRGHPQAGKSATLPPPNARNS
ncbi:rho-associated protein kinase 2-like [Physella acuta]|uniref:rho-associated protein kinase 2-like n=1 Tax=Physella acuta TaxID=109671 RepID=UPI0027DAE638|nr:rho-associated protein kinase 2-like [Physella acuta]